MEVGVRVARKAANNRFKPCDLSVIRYPLSVIRHPSSVIRYPLSVIRDAAFEFGERFFGAKRQVKSERRAASDL